MSAIDLHFSPSIVDGGNLIAGFGKAAATGSANFRNNLVCNPGLGAIWINEIFNNLDFHYYDIITRTTATPRKDNFFKPACDFNTIRIKDNLIECKGQPRRYCAAK